MVLFGGIPKFCEVDPLTMNIDPKKIEALVSPRTKMIIPIDYAGVPCEIGDIMEIAGRHGLIVLQDCAQSYGSYYKGTPSGSKAHLAAFSFHESKTTARAKADCCLTTFPNGICVQRFYKKKAPTAALLSTGKKTSIRG